MSCASRGGPQVVTRCESRRSIIGKAVSVTLPAIDAYLRLDRKRREIVHSDGDQAPLFQPHTNYRTLDFDKPLSTRMAQKIVKRWADYSRLGDLSPHDLRRTAITRALECGLSYTQVQMMSKHRDPKTVMRYDHGRENMEQNAVNFLGYDEEG
jgi:integrase